MKEVRMQGKRTKAARYDNSAYLMILPSYLVFLTMILTPIIWTVYLSFNDYDLKNTVWVGVQNYVNIFRDSIFLASIGHTVYFTALTLVPTIVLSLLLAVALNKKIRGQGVFRTLFYLPHILSMVAVSLSWGYLYNAQAGIINRVLKLAGLAPVGWLTDPNVAMISVAIMSVWGSLGYNSLLFLAGLQNIPGYLYEAAEIDGATKVQQFFRITIPQLRPTTFYIFIMCCIHSFEVFGQVFILTGGGPSDATTTIAHQVYRNGFEYYKMGYASAEAVVLLLIILTITVINYRYGGNTND